ncbi:hypothetical protein JTE90_027075 [Oedothorax gibbosus]|uniref:Uncharacterized protein n=1 Tax=Oedothorax gibbosus TaxID=931172 RepID=A0AAV6UP95_9ARAC|nr:hypothetical protein JTE90_027075 [Oedothorax gibbosus]
MVCIFYLVIFIDRICLLEEEEERLCPVSCDMRLRMVPFYIKSFTPPPISDHLAIPHSIDARTVSGHSIIPKSKAHKAIPPLRIILLDSDPSDERPVIG